MDDTISRQDAIDAVIEWYGCKPDDIEALEEIIKAMPSAQPERQHGRIFNEIVVEYPSINTYPEYEGKPYFSIKYTENGQGLIGYGTYNPEVLSEYLKEYFMPSAQPERKKGKWINRSLNILYPEWERYTCSACGKHSYNYDFCPNCGSYNGGESDDKG